MQQPDPYTFPLRRVSVESHCYRECDAVRREDKTAMETQSDDRVRGTSTLNLEDSTQHYSIVMRSRNLDISSLENDDSSSIYGNDDSTLYATVCKGF